MARFVLLLILVFSLLSHLSAATILTQTPQGNSPSLSLQGSSWDSFTAMMTAQHSLTSVNDFSNLQNHTFDAVWVNQERGNTLSSSEVTALRDYVSSGNKAVFMGENSSWPNWNQSLMGLVGGSHTNDCLSTTTAPSSSHVLVNGVSSVHFACGSRLSSTVGDPEILFSGHTMAAVYKIGDGEALVMLESNVLDDSRLSNASNTTFANNILTWLGEPVEGVTNNTAVPEPQSILLISLAFSFVALGWGKVRK